MIVQKTIKGVEYLYYVHSFRDKKCFGGTGKVKKIWYFLGKISHRREIDFYFDIKYLEYYFYTNQIDYDKFITEFNQFIEKYNIKVFPQDYIQNLKAKKQWFNDKLKSLEENVKNYNVAIKLLQKAIKSKDTDDINSIENTVDSWYNLMILDYINKIMNHTPKNEKKLMQKKIGRIISKLEN